MKIDFGMPTLIETDGLQTCARLCSELGLRFIELNMNMPQYQLGQMDAAQLRELAREYGIYYTIHLDENLNVSDFNPYIAEGYTRTALEAIALAKEMDMPMINMHLSKGVYFTLPERKVYLFDVYRDQYLQSILRFRDACAAAVGTSGIKIGIENCDGYTPFQKDAIERLLESPGFALTYDVGHNHGCGGADEPYILAHQKRLAHMHLHDAKGSKNHLELGTGELDVRKYLTLAEENRCRVVLETKTVRGLRASVRWLKDNGLMTE